MFWRFFVLVKLNIESKTLFSKSDFKFYDRSLTLTLLLKIGNEFYFCFVLKENSNNNWKFALKTISF